MLQILQNIKSGELKQESVPTPTLTRGNFLVKTHASLISAGTEKMLIDLAQKSLVGKAQARPDLVRQVINKVKKEGLLNTFNNVMSKMEKPMPLGYSAAGIIINPEDSSHTFGMTGEAGDSSPTKVGFGMTAGKRVAIAGAGYANHAEINSVPYNLTALIPNGVSFEEAAYTTVASIALQGVRLAKPELGEYVVVIGLGLIGLITVQLLKTNGCRVIGLDYDQRKIDLALKLGMDEGFNLSSGDAVKAVEKFTGGRLADHTLITAATKSNQPIELAGEITRRKGQVIAVGAVGMNIPRDVYYKKELELKISMSYGPGRYDMSYEEGGIDYPYDYVRWTEQRNMEAVLNLMAQKKLDVKSLTTHRFKFEDALKAYDMIKEAKEPYVGIILEYDVEKEHEKVVYLKEPGVRSQNPDDNSKFKTCLPIGKIQNSKLTLGFVGAGNYAALHLIPHLKKNSDVVLKGLVTATGLNAKQKAEKFGFEFCSTDYQSLLGDETNSVFIGTRHSTHADYVVRALNAGKNVFVEKPLCVNEEQLGNIIQTYHSIIQSFNHSIALMVGLNRRFAPMTKILKEQFENTGPKQMIYRVNSGHIPTSTWLHETAEGGGMMIGEMCHFIDLMQFISDELPISVYAKSLSLKNSNIADSDNVSITVEFDKGSVGTLNYNTVGDKSFSKERLEVYSGGKVGVLDDFRLLEIIGNGKKVKKKSANQDKGQANQIIKTVESFKNNTSPIPFNELVNGMLVIFAAKKSLISGQSIQIEPYKLSE